MCGGLEGDYPLRDGGAVNLPDECRWPALDEPYGAALRATVAYAFRRYAPIGVLAAGTIVRGNPGPTSDLDVFVIHRAPYRQRVQRRFAGVTAEVFVNPPAAIERTFASERARGRPSAAHMFATGSTVYDPEGEIARLRALAEETLARGPAPTEQDLTWQRYSAVTWLEDALDIAGDDPECCALLLHNAVEEAIRHAFWAAGRWQPRNKELLAALADLDPALADDARHFYRAADLPARIEAARALVDRAVEGTGFFAWESAPEDVGP